MVLLMTVRERGYDGVYCFRFDNVRFISMEQMMKFDDMVMVSVISITVGLIGWWVLGLIDVLIKWGG